MKKRLLTMLAIAICLIIVLTGTAFAAESGSCGKNLTWSFSDGVLTISGKGEMSNYAPDGANVAPWRAHNIEKVVIKQGVTSVGKYAFLGEATIREVSLPSSVVTINQSAFHHCTSLETISFPEGLQYIWGEAFANCGELFKVELPDSLVTLYGGAFRSCWELSEVVIGDNLKTVGNEAFAYCQKLESVKFGQSVDTIGEGAFEKCISLTSVSFPNSVKIIYDRAFSDTGLTELSFGNGIQEIWHYAFAGTKIKNITIPDSVTFFGREVFSMSDLESVTIGAGITALDNLAFGNCLKLSSLTFGPSIQSVHDSAFFDCDGLKNVYFQGSKSEWKYSRSAFRGAMIHYKDHTHQFKDTVVKPTCSDKGYTTHTCKQCGDTYQDSYTDYTGHVYDDGKMIQTPTKTKPGVKEYSCKYCTLKIQVTYPHESNIDYTCGDNLTWSVKNKQLVITGTGAMDDWGDNGNPPWIHLRQELTGVTLPEGLTSIGDGAFGSITNLKTIKLPEGLKRIGERAFGGSYLTEIVIPDTVTEIEAFAFSGSINLSEVKLGAGITSLSQGVFEDCDSLKEIDIPSNITVIGPYVFNGAEVEQVVLHQGLKEIQDGAFHNCPIREISIPKSVTKIGNSCFTDADLREVVIPGSIKEIPLSAFSGSLLEKVTLEEGVETIGVGAFDNCLHLKSVVLPGTLKKIDMNAFMECRSLTDINLPDSLTAINAHAFKGCKALAQVTIPSGIKTIDNGTFEECWSLSSVTLPDKLQAINEDAFYGCTSLKHIEIPETVSSIGSQAFASSGLEFLDLPEKLTSISQGLFNNCQQLKGVVIHNGVKKINNNAFWALNYPRHIYYCGTEKQWNSITIAKNNDDLSGFEYHYNWNCVCDHAYKAIITPPGCETQGFTTQVCEHCGQEYYDDFVSPVGHQPDKGVLLENHVSFGLVRFTCLTCGYSYEENMVHLYGDGEVSREPTCSSVGRMRYECVICGENKYEDIPKLEHNSEYRVKKVTCTEDGYSGTYCENCGKGSKENVVKAKGHQFDEGVIEKKPGEVDAGILCRTCSVCGLTKNESIPALRKCSGGKNCPLQKFSDVDHTHWAHLGMDYAIDIGLMNGTGTGKTFEPNADMSRAMLVTVLWRYSGSPSAPNCNFTDVKKDDWFYKAVAWAASEGVVKGMGDGSWFDPNGKVTREMLATILYRYAKMIDVDVSATASISGFPDANRVADWAKDYVKWAVAEGIISGAVKDGKTVLAPQDSGNRAVVATIMARFITNVVEAS